MQQLKVIRASAGSGKTYTLASEYIKLLFNDPEYFSHILAVTFTNKATNEMKSRIVRELNRLAKGLDTTLLPDLLEFTKLPESQLRNKAGIILKKLLHQYSDFAISTIDSFFQRIIRSFTRELGLQGTYSIELDTETLLTEVIDQLMIQAETDNSLLAWLISYAESLIEKGNSWNFRKSISDLGKEIFREEFKSLTNQVAWKSDNRNILKNHLKELRAGRLSIEREYRAFGQKAWAILDKAGLEADDFSMKDRGPAGFLVKLISGEFRKPTATAIQSATNPEKWFTRTSARADDIKLLAINELMPLMQQVIEYYNAHFRLYFTFEVILQNIFTLGILSDLSNLAYRWCNENNAFLLPEAPLFLQKIIDGNDTPFIYEKAGYWFHHFMIDEFQDTSMLQWLNFKPLISNSLSQGFDNMVVGDVKQSIYRWRNSNWTILAQGIDNDFPGGIVKSLSLDHNWRSGKNIIEFNNRFFRDAAKILDNEFQARLQHDGFPSGSFETNPVARLYSDIRQEPGHLNYPEGLVQIRFIKADDDNYYDLVNQKLVALLNDLMDKGYHPEDIAIITRKNREAKLLADFLLNYRHVSQGLERSFNVISDEALRLGSSSVVVFLISLLRYLVEPANEISCYYMLSFFKNNLIEGMANGWLLPSNDHIARELEIRKIMPSEFFELAESARSISLAEIVERLISIFNLSGFRGETVYLDAFRDMVQEFGQKYVADPGKFLEYWNETGKEKSISAPAGQEAIRILTVHKSKGLEFNVVIVPYCQWELNPIHNSVLWCRAGEEPFSNLGTIPLTYSPKLMKTIFAGDYYREFLNQYIDNLNLLYVAFTRSCKGLFVFCKEENEDSLKSVSGLTTKVMSDFIALKGTDHSIPEFPGTFDESLSGYSYGSLPGRDTITRKKSGEILLPSSVSIKSASKRIKVAYQGKIYLDPAVNMPKRPLNEGKILHEIFTSIRTKDDIGQAVNGMYMKGKINLAEKVKYITLIAHLMNDTEVIPWFTDNWKVLTEAEIIMPEGVSKRPDRVMTREGQTLIIDYKFGTKMDPAYNSQVRQYSDLLRQMGYSAVTGYLWYVMIGKVILVQ